MNALTTTIKTSLNYIVSVKRVSKVQAKKAFLRGKQIILVPCKCMPDSIMALTTQYTDEDHADFEGTIKAFKYYNCCSELGYYPAFYIWD